MRRPSQKSSGYSGERRRSEPLSEVPRGLPLCGSASPLMLWSRTPGVGRSREELTNSFVMTLDALRLLDQGVLVAALACFCVAAASLPWVVAQHARLRRRGMAAERELLARPLPDDDALPHVLIQLPTCNDGAVIRRVADACGDLDWPREKLHIQVLDDSTDGSQEIADEAVASLSARGLDAVLLRRSHRAGFKARRCRRACSTRAATTSPCSTPTSCPAGISSGAAWARCLPIPDWLSCRRGGAGSMPRRTCSRAHSSMRSTPTMSSIRPPARGRAISCNSPGAARCGAVPPSTNSAAGRPIFCRRTSTSATARCWGAGGRSASRPWRFPRSSPRAKRSG